MNTKMIFKERIYDELNVAKYRFNEIKSLYDSAILSDRLPESYIEYLKRELDIALMTYQYKERYYVKHFKIKFNRIRKDDVL